MLRYMMLTADRADGERMRLARHDLRSSLRRALLLAAAPLVLLLAPTQSLGAFTLTVDNSYTQADSICHQMGQSDNEGVFYTTCGNKVYRYDRFGVRLADIALPAGVVNPRDVAPSPDGAFLYISQGVATPRRLNRQPDGAYILDATWALKKLSYWNIQWTPVGHAIATDGRGDIYVSNGSFWVGNTQTSVAKFKPNGDSITTFGDYGPEDGNWITNMDIAVSRDGRRVFVGENCGRACNYADPNYQGSRVTRYDFTAGGTYRFSRIVSAQGPMDGNPFPRCQSLGATHSAYSLALDYAENLYVTSTTCGRIQMFDTDADPAKDRFVRSIAIFVDDAAAAGIVGKRNHYIASDWAGRLYTSEWAKKFTPNTIAIPALPLPALAPLPEPDILAPTLTAITMPPATPTQNVAVTITATDNAGVAEMQIAREDGNWGPWQPFASPVNFTLSPGFGIKGVYVRVRDMAGNESISLYRTVAYQLAPIGPPVGVPDAADPVLSQIAVPALTATRDVQVTLTATDDTGVTHVRFANEDGNWGAWQAFAATKTWTLTAGQGAKLVYAQVRDAGGRESTVLNARTTYTLDAPAPPPDGIGPDAIAPLLTALALPAETTTQTIQATLTATDNVGVSQVRFANEDGVWTAWQAWAATKAWTLTAGFGGKLVYAQVRDATGNESLVINKRTSYVQTVAGPIDVADPLLTAVVIPDPTPTANVTVRLTATDDVGVAQVRFANEDGNWLAWRAFEAQVPHTLTAGNTIKVVYAQVRDAAGRESNVMFVRTQVTG